MNFLEYINENIANTARDETAACIGVVASDMDMKYIGAIAELKSAKSIKEDPIKYEAMATKAFNHIKSIINKQQYDWNSSGVTDIEKIASDDWNNIIDICKMAKGMYDFIQEKVRPIIPSPTFIHGSISQYRKVEQETLGKIEGEKASVVDCIIMSAKSPSDLFKSMKTNGVDSHPEESKGYVDTGDYAYFQISLKKSRMSQQGKFTTAALKQELVPTAYRGKNKKPEVDYKGSLDPTLDAAAKFMNKNKKNNDDVNEGKISDFFKNMWSWMVGKIKPSIQKLKATTIEWINPVPDQQHFQDILSLYGNTDIQEAKDDNFFISKSGKKITDPFYRKVILSISNNPNVIIDEINRKLIVAGKKAKTNNIVMIINKLNRLNKITGDPGDVIQTCYALACNYITSEFLINFVSQANNINDTIKQFIVGMKIGATKLPVWKVFGYGEPPRYLGTYDTYLKEQEPHDIDPFGVKVYPNTRKSYGYKEYYVFNILMLEDLNDQDKEYVFIRSGSFSSSRLSFAMEGVSIIGPYKLEKTMESILDKVKD